MAAITESPIAESTEYRPPTQSQNPNMLSVSMPNSSTSFLLVETATKCLATGSSPSASVSARRAPGVGLGPQPLLPHHRPEVRAADADVDDGADPLAGGAGPLAAAQPIGEIAHGAEYFVHIGDHVLP